MNLGAQAANGEILLLTDVRQHLEPTAARRLVRNFADPAVGAASGELVLADEYAANHQAGLGLYWRYEKALRQAEGRFHSTIGYTGALSVIRKHLFAELPNDTLVDDLVMPLRVMAKGYRVVFEDGALALDRISEAQGQEFSRKVRTLAGVFQTLVHLREIVWPPDLRVWWPFVSHKALRLIVPYALALALLCNFFLRSPFYSAILWAQICLYGLGIVGLLFEARGGLRRIVSVPSAFLMLNLAALVGPLRYLSGEREDLWSKVPAKQA